ncbi:hypothetical protein LY90DRAFT_174309 [Neocallimastix californiae]|uniref:Uncharacterized protein n=1 Tax=Neocallimastix californiae TaxID=1754190 RepID=A0A1Y2A2G3_9FUNG|nr:hypothetical protein LY90DRAFT_174309 [Neocallimastix californiae]|eukprot:ORY16195.1 hypothetical protein LY90DRAFT_174309 [Neocallimastix californiae]
MDYYKTLRDLCKQYNTVPNALIVCLDKAITDTYHCNYIYDIKEGLNIINVNRFSKYRIIIDYVTKKFTDEFSFPSPNNLINLDERIPFIVVNKFLSEENEISRKKDGFGHFKVKDHSKCLYVINKNLSDLDISNIYDYLNINNEIKRIAYKNNYNNICCKTYESNNNTDCEIFDSNSDIDIDQLTSSIINDSEIDNIDILISLKNNELLINTTEDAIIITTSHIYFYNYNTIYLINKILSLLDEVNKVDTSQNINNNLLIKVGKSNMYYSIEFVKEPINFRVFDLMLKKKRFKDIVTLDKSSVNKEINKDTSRTYTIHIGDESFIMKIFHNLYSYSNVFYFPELEWHNHKLSQVIVKKLYSMYEAMCYEINHFDTINYKIFFDGYYSDSYTNPDIVLPIKADPDLCRKKIVKYIRWRGEYFMAPLGSGCRITYFLEKSPFNKHKGSRKILQCVKIKSFNKNKNDNYYQKEDGSTDDDDYFYNNEDKIIKELKLNDTSNEEELKFYNNNNNRNNGQIYNNNDNYSNNGQIYNNNNNSNNGLIYNNNYNNSNNRNLNSINFRTKQ